jgi:hypothetical protein
MYLHIGQDTVVRSDEILGIFDIESTSISPVTKEFLSLSQQTGCVVNVTDDLPKSFILCIPDGEKHQSKESLSVSQHEDCDVNVTDDLHKSSIVRICDGKKPKNEEKVYISQISTSTLFKRATAEEVKGFLG